MAVKLETDLYPPIKAYFARRGYEVKAEVRGCDLVALRPDETVPVIVEMKKTFTLPLLLQGVDRQRTGAFVWLAVERNRTKKGAHNQRFHELAALCGRLALGLMTVTFYKTKEPVIEVWCEPGPGGRAYALAAPAAAGAGVMEAAEEAYSAGYAAAGGGRKRAGAKPLLKEFAARSGDYNLGGSTGRKLVTAYRERAIQCALALACHGPLPPKRIRELTQVADPGALLRDNHYAWFRKAERGIYQLTPEGAEALKAFGEVTKVWAARFEWAAAWEPNGDVQEGTQ